MTADMNNASDPQVRTAPLPASVPQVVMIEGTTPAERMAERVASLRTGLAGCGFAPGARVVLQVRDQVTALAAFYGALGTELVLVPVHSTTPAPELRHILTDSGAVALLSDTATAADDLPDGVVLLNTGAWPNVPAAGQAPDADPDAPAMILYTSGTTGAPKGVVFTHANISQIGRHFPTQVLDLTADDMLLLPLELNSPIGVVLAICAWYSGAGLAVVGRMDPARAIATLQVAQVSVMLGVPTLAAMILAATRDTPDPFPALRHVILGGNPVMTDLADRITNRFGCALSVVFAMTELVPGLILRDRAGQPDGSIGWPAPGLAAALLDPDGQEQADGEIGELAVAGPQLQAGYWQSGRIEPLTGPDGWYRTGDLGYRAADGNTVLVGRAKEIILTGGYTIYPVEVEQALERHPDVVRAALVGRPHRDFGEIPVAFVVRAPGSTLGEAALIRWAKTQILPAKCPRAVQFIDTMPMTGSGKIRKTALTARDADDRS
jgi:long-chain acyl-CoA synthetase